MNFNENITEIHTYANQTGLKSLILTKVKSDRKGGKYQKTSTKEEIHEEHDSRTKAQKEKHKIAETKKKKRLSTVFGQLD